jgi:hypothetical protein
MLGMLDTKMGVPFGRPAVRVFMAFRNSDWKVAVGVMVATDDVHTSLAPIRMVT